MSTGSRFEKVESTTAATNVHNPRIEQPQEKTTASNTTALSGANLKQLRQLSNTILRLQGTVSNIQDKFQASDTKSAELDAKIKDTENKLEASKNDQIQILAVFVGLFTFISIEFQLFKQAESSYILPLSLSIGGILLAFLAALVLILRGERTTWIITLIASGVITAGIGVFLYHGAKSEVEQYTRNDVSNICRDLKEKIAEGTIHRKPEETQKLMTGYEILLCE